MANEWIATSQQLPKDGEVVHTKIDDEKGCRNEQLLKRQGNLWFFSGWQYVCVLPPDSLDAAFITGAEVKRSFLRRARGVPCLTPQQRRTAPRF